MNTQKLKDKILQMAIQGKLVKQNPNDEPAIKLLNRIKNEKEQLIKDKKIKQTKELSPIEDDEKPFNIPDSWEWVRLEEVTYNHGQKKPDSRFTYIDVGSIDNKKCRLSKDTTNLRPEDAPSRARKLIKFGSVIYSTVRPYLMNIAIIDREFDLEPIVSTGFAVLHPHITLSNRFLYFYLRSGSFNDFVSNQMVGIAYPAINERTLLMGILPLPPLEEQLRIVKKIDQLFTVIDNLEGNKEEMLIAIKETRNKVLDEAIRGNLVEQDSNDEPAEDLLKRIRQEKEQLIKEKKLKKTKGLSPIADDEKPFDIPESWEWVRLGEIINVSSGKFLNAKSMESDGIYPVFGGNGINGYHNKFNVPESTIVIGRVGYYCGSVHITNKKSWITDNAFITSYFPECTNLFYLVWLLKTINLRKNDNATAQPVISGAKIYPLVVPLPPLKEQHRIAEKIDAILTICDDLENQLLN